MNFRNPWDFEGEQAAKALDSSVLDSKDHVLDESSKNAIDEKKVTGYLYLVSDTVYDIPVSYEIRKQGIGPTISVFKSKKELERVYLGNNRAPRKTP